MEIFINLFIGILGSIVASIVIALCLHIYEFGAKSKILYRIDFMMNYIWIIDNKYTYLDDYNEIVHCAEEILRMVREICDYVKPLNLRYVRCICKNRLNRKMFFTVLYDIQSRCEMICFQTVGYSGQQETEERIKALSGKQIIYNEDETAILEMEAEWLKDIASGKKPVYRNDIINVNSFRMNKKDKMYIRNKGIKQCEFEKIMEGQHGQECD